MSGHTDKYPYDCARCGMCCVHEPCPIAKSHGVTQAPCSYLQRESVGENPTTCRLFQDMTRSAEELGSAGFKELIRRMFGVGVGCCIRARVVIWGQEVDFSSLNMDFKRMIANKVQSGEVRNLDGRLMQSKQGGVN